MYAEEKKTSYQVPTLLLPHSVLYMFRRGDKESFGFLVLKNLSGLLSIDLF